MRRRHRLAVIAGAVLGIASVGGAAAVPAVAGGPTTHHVGPATSGGGSCSSPDFGAIQDAVDAAGPGDTILVCPGRYRDNVLIEGAAKDGLTLRATEPWAARLRPPAGAGSNSLVTITDADGVTVQWLNLRAPTGGTCDKVSSMIRVSATAERAVIRANRIRPGGPETLGACGYSTGISSSGPSAWIGYNLVRDFSVLGIEAGNGAKVTRNSLRAWHLDEAPGSGGFAGIYAGSDVRVIDNHVVGRPSAGDTTPQLALGISVDGGNTSALIRGNLVRYAQIGVRLFEITSPGTGRVVIRDNEVHDNSAQGMWIALYGFNGSVIRGNDFRGNGGLDCDDGSRGAATWVDNLGDDANIPGICDPGVVGP